MVLNENQTNLENLSVVLKRIYWFVTNKMDYKEIGKVCDMLEELECKLLLFKKKLRWNGKL